MPMACSDGKSPDMAMTERAVISTTPRRPAAAAARATRLSESAWTCVASRIDVSVSFVVRPLNASADLE